MPRPFDLDDFGDLVATIGSRQFGPAFHDLFRRFLDADECTVFVFPDPSTPSSLLVEGKSDEDAQAARQLANDYVAGGYLLDPNLQNQPANGSIYVQITDPNDIFDSEYRKHYYDGALLTQELVVLASAGSTLYYTSFYRKTGKRGFDETDISSVRIVAGFMVKTLHRHSELVSGTPEALELSFVHAPSEMSNGLRKRTLEYLRSVLMSGPGKLTQREAEICARIIMGYSTEAISLNCSISINTVATHRKRAYAKLGISSQNELFLRYFSAVRRFQSSLS